MEYFRYFINRSPSQQDRRNSNMPMYECGKIRKFRIDESDYSLETAKTGKT